MACGGGATGTPTSPLTTAEPDSPFTEVDRSILGIIPAVDIGEDGKPVDPGFTFAPDTPQITVVAVAGNVTTAPIDITWFQVTDEGDVQLFTHTVELGSFQAAFSVGTNPGTLTSGTYRVDATLEGESLSTTFQVEAPEGAAAIALRVGARVPAGRFTGQAATSGPPTSGNSGSTQTFHEGGSLDGESFARWVITWEDIDRDSGDIWFGFYAGKPGGGATLEAQATMGDITRTRSYPLMSEPFAVSRSLRFDPCAHPGGSDLPGAVAEFSISVIGPGDEILAGGASSTTLGPDEVKPFVTIDSQPPNRSRVEAHDEIILTATAVENRDGPTWQEGLNSFKLIANPGGLVGEEQRSDAGSPQPCGSKQWSLTSQATYTVPDDAPPVIRICGEALDFGGNFSEPACNEYYTGAVETLSSVSGSYIYYRDITTTSSPGYVETDKQVERASFNLVAVGEGRLEGQGHVSFMDSQTYTSPTDCPFGSHIATVEWDVFYEGLFYVNPDGGINLDITGTPRFGPDYVSTLTYPGCEDLDYTVTLSGPATVDILGITLVDGQYYYHEDYELQENQTGQAYLEVTAEASH